MSTDTDLFSKYKTMTEVRISSMFETGGILAPPSVPKSLSEVMEYALDSGGKRVRPILCLLSCSAAGGQAEEAVDCAAAIEALHTYTLIHDDMPCMDNDMVRRGKPAVHAKFGYAEAVLAGDALQAAAFNIAVSSPLPSEIKVRIMRELAVAAGPSGVVGGQWEDVTSHPPYSEPLLQYVHKHKTADLIICACSMGALAGGADEVTVCAFREYATCVGLAFQIVDDILDSSDPTKSDEMNILHLMSEQEAMQQASILTNRAEKTIISIRAAGLEARLAVEALADFACRQLARKI